MSGAAPKVASMSAVDIKLRAAGWLERCVSEDWNEQDQRELEAWLEESWAHSVAYWRLKTAWNRAGRLIALRSSERENFVAERRRILRRRLGRTAAMLAIVGVFGFGAAVLLSRSSEQAYATPVGGHKTIAFADGTSVELNTDTLLRADVSGLRRTVWLDRGEAYFQVRHDAMHPFIVMVGDRQVKDLGTKFLIRRDTRRLEVSVVEGRVRFDSSKNTQSLLLTQGDTAIATATTFSVTRQPVSELARELGWRRGVVVFDNTALADAVAEFNRYNREKIIIADPAIGRLLIGATFPINDVERFSRVAQDVFGVRAVKRGNVIVILR